jgi:hypothetical protein
MMAGTKLYVLHLSTRMRTDQSKISEWLAQEVPTLHPAYERAVQLMDGPDSPGRSNFVCHACRDICTVIQQFHRVEKTTRSDTKTLLNDLDVLWSQRQFDELSFPIASIADAAEPGKLPEDVAVPRSILQAIQSVLQEHRRGAANQKNQALDMFQILAPEAAGRPDLFDAHAEQWHALRDWFHKYAHFTLKEKRCDETELRAQFLLLETHLLTMISTFYEGVEELDRLLGQEPTPDTVARAIARMSHPEQQRYFFDRLQKPEWLEPLREKGMFDTPPEPGRDLDKGTIWFYDWPAAGYLSRMSPREPAAVAKILIGLPSTENPYIVRTVLEAALQMPAALCATLAPKIAKLIETPFWFASEIVGGVAVNLAAGGEQREALQILRSLLTVIPDPRMSLDPSGATGLLRKREATTRLRAHDYAAILHTRGKELTLHLGLTYLKMLTGLLRSALAEERSVDATTTRKTEDYSFVWQPRLGSRSFHESARHLLIPAVLDAAETLCEADSSNISEVIALISKYRFKVYDRIVLEVLAKHPAHALATEKLLDKERFFDPGTRQEYDALAAAVFPYLSIAYQNTYLSWIDEGIERERFEGGDRTPEAIDATIEHWKFQRLSPLKSVLPSDRQTQFATLEARFGEVKSYSNPIAQGGAYAISDESPLDRVALGALEPDQAIEYLRSWRPTKNDPFPFGYSPQGLGAVFEGVVADSPERFVSRLEDIKTLNPFYLTGALRGFGSALRADKEFELGPVLALALWIAEQPATVPNDAEAEAGPDFSGAKHNVVDLIQEGFRRQKLSPSEQETIWKIIALLAEDKWGTLHFREPESQTQDAWFHSLNFLRPKAVRAAFQYLQWSMGIAGQTAFAFSGVPALSEFFSRHTDPALEPCLSVRLIFGELFPFLHAMDPSWAEKAVSRIFPEAPDLQSLRDVAWTAYLSANQSYDAVFALLEPQYRASIFITDEQRLLGKSNTLEHASGLVSYHLLQQYWRGRISLSPGSLLSDFFLHAEEKGRRGAIIYVGRSLREATDQVPAEVIQRLVELWDNRLEAAKRDGASGEMRAFSWWFFTGYFEDEWALKSLHAALKVTEGQLDIIMESLSRLADLVEIYPMMVVECTQLITNASPENVVMWTSDLVTILRSALRSSDLAAPPAARALIEDLGIRGHLGYRNLLTDDPSTLGNR